ncbi:hypothetical protein TRP8649_04330 [Pelagimonas phthalicica]|uniref:Uncharacterized protein n=1 Tax=Pelagimonas phthalicica TaxID=1037362 RepID=A0A238JHN8_9RHOB|nr:hypothetical protein [Pelagimonas phthalicica]TDS90021.1 hypothetical protein CLV87_4076 [Pelagimonas phthalicica]SMX30188.1 hypothetical protein TRP8649_04330 [Pelagimonas phthalicica]
MKRFVCTTALVIVASTAFASGPDTLKMKFKVEDGIHKMLGVFGSDWAPGQVQSEAAKNCAEIGKPFGGLQVLGRNAQGLTVFEARCK